MEKVVPYRVLSFSQLTVCCWLWLLVNRVNNLVPQKFLLQLWTCNDGFAAFVIFYTNVNIPLHLPWVLIVAVFFSFWALRQMNADYLLKSISTSKHFAQSVDLVLLQLWSTVDSCHCGEGLKHALIHCNNWESQRPLSYKLCPSLDSFSTEW